jgi:hypothetical protein
MRQEALEERLKMCPHASDRALAEPARVVHDVKAEPRRTKGGQRKGRIGPLPPDERAVLPWTSQLP